MMAEAERLAALSDEDIDLSDMPEVTDWSRARRGLFSAKPRRTLSVSLEAELVDYVEKDGSGTLDDRLNSLLRDWVSNSKQAAE